MVNSIIQELGQYQGNQLYIKREDLIPFSFGGNKARKAALFFEDFDKEGYDCIVTYGSSSSNHCRVVANICASRGVDCHIVGPQEASDKTANSSMMNIFKVNVTIVPVNKVSKTIENILSELKLKGKRPYFIPGGGHGNIGTQAFVNCYKEIKDYDVGFDYVFLASGTGTTQAGLVAGKLMYNGKEKIVGISIARKNPRGRHIVLDSISEYLTDKAISSEGIEKATNFVDDYIGGGYARQDEAVNAVIKNTLIRYGIPLDFTYTGKAFYGMSEFIIKNKIIGKKILFIHTGGTPLFFDSLNIL